MAKKLKLKQKRIPPNLEKLITDSVNLINSITHGTNEEYVATKDVSQLKKHFENYLYKFEDEEEKDSYPNTSGLDEKEYVETFIDDDGFYHPRDEAYEYLDALDCPEAIETLYSFLNRPYKTLDARKKPDRLAMIKLLDLKSRFKELRKE